MLKVDEVIVILAGFLGIIFTWWFFLFKDKKMVRVSHSVDIKVSGGYFPETIVIPKGQIIKLNFIRTDPSDCLSEVVLGDFRIRKELPLNQKVTVEIKPEKSGEYSYSCGMNMYHGKIVVYQS